VNKQLEEMFVTAASSALYISDVWMHGPPELI